VSAGYNLLPRHQQKNRTSCPAEARAWSCSPSRSAKIAAQSPFQPLKCRALTGRSNFFTTRHQCVGIDYSPASIGYATECAQREQLPCTYEHQDLRLAECGEGFGLVMLIFGEFNIFRPSDARSILLKAHRALGDAGLLLLEPYTLAAVQEIGEQGLVWSSAERGLFSDKPYVYLVENIWNAATHTTTTRYFIVDAASGQVRRYAQTFQAYSNAEYESLLVECGFGDVLFFPSLTGVEDASASDFMAIVAHKREG
jgi:hypothetical protein